MIRVVAGLLERDGALLIARRLRPPAWAGWWEFPGGKIEQGETDAIALAREMQEELGVQVDVGDPVITALHDFWPAETSASTQPGPRIAISVYRIVAFTGSPVAREHGALAWVSTGCMSTYKLLPADVVVLQALEALSA